MLSVESKLGHGAYGVVYKCTTNNTNCAVKTALINKRVDFLGGIRELDLSNKTSGHVYIIKLLDILPGILKAKGRHITPVKRYKNDTYSLAFELAYCSLDGYIKSNGTKNIQAIKYLMVHYLLGLDFLHAKGIGHRDLKPGNLLIVNDAKLGLIGKIGDLGTAKLMLPADDNTYNVGTILYQPPEWLSHIGQGFYTDIWAMGCIFYEMLTGFNPFATSRQVVTLTPDYQIEVIKSGSYKTALARDKIFTDRWDAVPGPSWSQLVGIIESCLQLDYKRRPSIRDILDCKAFDAYRSHITDVRRVVIYESPNTVTMMCNDNNRLTVLSYLIEAYQFLRLESWFRLRILFTAMDIWDRYNFHLQQNVTKTTLEDNVFNLCVCLYIAINYHVVFEFNDSFGNLVIRFLPALKHINLLSKAKDIAEYIVGKVVLPGSIRRYTALDAAMQLFELTASQKLELLGYVISAKSLHGKTMTTVAVEWVSSRKK